MCFKNIKYALKIVWKSSPIYVIFQIVITLFSILGPMIDVVAPAYIIDMLVENKSVSEIFRFIIVVVTIELIRGMVITFFTTWISPVLQEKIKISVNTLLIQKLQNTDYINLEMPDYYDRLELSFRQADQGLLNVVDSFFIWFNTLLYLTSLIAILSVLEPFLVIITVTTSCMILLSQVVCANIDYNYEKQLIKEERKQNYLKNIFYQYNVFADIKVYGCDKLFFRHFLKVGNNKGEIIKEKSQKNGIVNLVSNILKICFLLAGTMFYIVYKIDKGLLAVSAFVALYTATIQCTNQLIELVNTSSQLYKKGLYVNNFKSLYDIKPQIEKEGGCECNFSKEINIEKLSFAYNSSEKLALRDVSMKINKGQFVAIVGANGAGKSTLVKLLLRLYDPNKGRIMIDGVDIKYMDVDSLRKRISYLPQKMKIYSVSIAENILMKECDSELDEKKVYELLKIVDLKDKVDKLPKGIHTILTKEYDENGTIFSGGEIQKIVLARTLLKPADIIIMDEPSSAMDPLSVDAFFKNMLILAQNKTVITITHQLSLTKLADIIYCFDQGELVEYGKHESLMANNSVYRQMYEAQSVWYE